MVLAFFYLFIFSWKTKIKTKQQRSCAFSSKISILVIVHWIYTRLFLILLVCFTNVPKKVTFSQPMTHTSIFKYLLFLSKGSIKILRHIFKTELISILTSASVFPHFAGTPNLFVAKIYNLYLIQYTTSISEISQIHSSILQKQLRYQYFLKAVSDISLQRIPLLKYIFSWQFWRQYNCETNFSS